MKTISTAFTLSALAAALCTVANADKAFHHNDTAHGNSTSKIKTAANFGNGGAKIELCPSGDCATGQLITLSMSRLEELDDKNKTAQKAANFASLSASWTDFETLDIAGIEAMSTSFVADVPVGKADTAKFNLTATIYTANGTAMNGNQTIDVPAGALKFSVSISSWPFMAVTNRLTFGINLKARGKGNKDQGAPSKKAKGGNHTDIDRVSLGEGMFMDAPTLAVVDGVDTAIDSSLETTGSVTEFVWVFPHFTTSVYYDPVSGSEDASATSTTSSDASAAGTETSTPTTTPASTTDTPTPSPSPSSGSSAKVWASYVIAVAAAASAYFIVV